MKDLQIYKGEQFPNESFLKYYVFLIHGDDQLNTYLLNKFNIPAVQHRIIHRLSIFSIKMLNFVSAPKILREVFVKSLEEKSLAEDLISIDSVDAQKEPIFIPVNKSTLRNGKTFLTKPEIFTKFYLKDQTTFQNPFIIGYF